MINQKLKELLQCPSCRSRKLTFSEAQIKCAQCSATFEISDGIPDMLVKNTTVGEESEIHRAFQTTFNYIDHYQKDAFEFDYYQERPGATGHNERRLREFISRHVPKEKGFILDVGCGNAWVAEYFCKKDYTVLSFDISQKNTHDAVKNYPSENHVAVVGDVFSLPFQPEKFDCIIASEVIEHVTVPAKFTETLFRALKPGGKLIVTTPYKEKIIYTLCVHCNRPTPRSAHLHSFDEQKILSLYNGDDVKKVEFFKFGNKALAYLRTHILLSMFGFRVWRLVDKFANRLYNKPLNILVKWEKQS